MLSELTLAFVVVALCVVIHTARRVSTEGTPGVLLCGLSTAFIFVVLNAPIQISAGQQADV